MLSSHTVEPLLDAVGAVDGKSLLDVGCGPGILSARAVARGCVVTGVDVAEPMLTIARSAVPAASFAQGDVQAGLPYADGSFDGAAGNMVVHHLAQPALALSHLYRVLAPGGRLGLTMWDPPGDNLALGIFNDALAEVGAPPADLPVLPPRPDDAGFRSLFAAAGFGDVDVTHLRFEFVVDPDRWWHAVVASTALTAAQIARQPQPVQDRIKAAYDDLVAPFVDGTGQARLRASATLAVGTRRD
jgi:SAM-dependent methyltransferase